MNAKRQTMSLGTQMAPLGTGDAVVYMGDIYQVQMDINVEANKTVVLTLRQPHWAPNHVVLADSRNVWPDLPKSA